MKNMGRSYTRCSALICATAGLLIALSGYAAADEVSITLTGGEVVGKVRGRGKASVTAEATNLGGRELNGIRIAVYYSTADEYPGSDADWRVHEFVFEPPLPPGGSTTLRFTDDNVAEYVLIEVRRAQFGRGVSYNGRAARLEYALDERGGVTYIATRDLMNLIGGGISYDPAAYEVVLERKGVEVRFKEGSSTIKVNGGKQSIEHKVIEIDGRSFLPLSDFASLFSLSVSRDSTLNLIVLSDA